MNEARQAIQKVNYSHDAMVDLIVQHPGINQRELAASFGYTEGWISQIIASDAFQTRLAARRDEIVDPLIKATVEERFRALVFRSLEILGEKLKQSPMMVPDQLALRTAELASKALGYGARIEPPAPPGGDRLEELGDRLIGLLDKHKQRSILDGQVERAVEGEVTPIKEG